MNRVAIVVLGVLCATGLRAQSTADLALAQGRGIYQLACLNCHAGDGKGAPQSDVGFSDVLPDFTDCSYASREAGQDWFTVAHQGGPIRGFSRRMPAFGSVLTTEELERVVAYVRSFCRDDNWPRGELNLPRATFTEKAFPEDESVLTGTADRTPGARSFRFEYVHEKRFGARNQLELRVPVIFRDRSAQQRGWTGGHIGDIALAVKRAVFHTQSLTSASIVTVGGEVILPTGDAPGGFGKGTVVLEPFLLAGKMLGPDAFVQFHGGLEFPTKREKGENEAFARLALGRSFVPSGFGRMWTPMVELLGAGVLERGGAREYDVVPQLQFALNKRQHILANVGARLPLSDRSVRSSQFVFYVLWDWFDGGLRDGW